MLRIAMVEDEAVAAEDLKANILHFGKEYNEECEITVFTDCLDFLDGYNHSYDVIFMDIEMPSIDGMQAAHKLRELDANIPIVFVTNMKQFAIEGYTVAALDFILKPVNYYRLSSVLKKVIRDTREKSAEKVIKVNEQFVKIKISSIYYVEVTGRELIYHTEAGDIRTYGSLKALEQEFASHGFVRCHNAYLVNLKHVKSVKKDSLIVGEKQIIVSRYKRKELLQAMGTYMGDK